MVINHFPDADQHLPLCGTQDSWHGQQGMVIATLAEADAAVRRLVAGEVLNLRITDTALYTSLAHDTFDWLEGYNQRNPDAAFYGAYAITCSDAQQCVILQRTE